MKLPNNFGTIYMLSGNRRNPYIARKTIGYDNQGKQIFKTIGYYATREEALQGLALYNNCPYDIDLKNITLKDLYKKWLLKQKKKVDNEKLATNSLKPYENVFKNHCKELQNIIFANIKTRHIQSLVDNSSGGYTIKKYIKTLFNQLYDFASEIDIPVKNYARYVELGKQTQSTLHKNISEKDLNILWENVNMQDVDLVLILAYSGMRPNELLNMLSDNVFLKDSYMIGGSKTESGKNRIIPIHDKIKPLIENRLKNNNKYLITNTYGSKLTYDRFKERFDKLMIKLNLDYLPYDCRHTTATRLKQVNADILFTKKILGHKVADLLYSVYTHIDNTQLINTINLLA